MQNTFTDNAQNDPFFQTDNANIHNMNREETLSLLEKVLQIIKNKEHLINEEKNILAQINKNIETAESIQKKYPSSICTTSFLIGLLVGIFAGACSNFFIGLIAFFVVFFILFTQKKKKHFEKYGLQQEKAARRYLEESNTPLYEKKEQINLELEELKASGKIDWAEDIIGEELFTSNAVSAIYNLIKNRRADSLKEALNLYDESLHRTRMEEMQADIQYAVEVTAAEAIKQTEYTQEIAKNTHEAATAAKATAVHTRQASINTRNIDKNTRRFR